VTAIGKKKTLIGKQKMFQGQVYLCIDIEPHTCRDGRETRLAVWRSACAECGGPFVFRLPVSHRKFMPSRRCTKHRRPGVRVWPPFQPASNPKPANRSGK
jgi:hypothetical protein